MKYFSSSNTEKKYFEFAASTLFWFYQFFLWKILISTNISVKCVYAVNFLSYPAWINQFSFRHEVKKKSAYRFKLILKHQFLLFLWKKPHVLFLCTFCTADIWDSTNCKIHSLLSFRFFFHIAFPCSRRNDLISFSKKISKLKVKQM